MSVLSDNMRYLRAQLNFSQQKVADNLIITRGRYAKYEDGASEPPIEILLKISKYFKISIDLLVSIDIRKYPLEEIIRLPDNRIVLPIKVDTSGENRIEIIPHKAFRPLFIIPRGCPEEAVDFGYLRAGIISLEKKFLMVYGIKHFGGQSFCAKGEPESFFGQ